MITCQLLQITRESHLLFNKHVYYAYKNNIRNKQTGEL